MSQVFLALSGYGLMTAVAAIDAGLVPPSDNRVLVTANAARVPETAPDIGELAHLKPLRDRFDRVESLGAVLAPIPPVRWEPRVDDQPMLERLLRHAWGLGARGDDPIELFVQSIQVTPAKALVEVFSDATVTVLGDGLMTYSPIRNRMPHPTLARIGGVVYADVVPGVTPALFTELGATAQTVPAAAFAAAVRAAAAAADEPALDALDDGTPTALVLGQYLAALGLMTEEDEVRAQREMVELAAAGRPGRIVFKPHPSAPPRATAELRAAAVARGVPFVEYRGELPAEVLATRLPIVGAVAGFSTALPTLDAVLGIPVAAVDTDRMLRSLQPYENSNRVPLAIVDALTRRDDRWRTPAPGAPALQDLVDTVAYAMQPVIMAHLRPRAEALLGALDAPERARYVPTARLTELGLPGRAEPRWIERATRPRALADRASEWALVARGVARRSRRAWKALQG